METYIVIAGDSLGSIASKIFGDAGKWREIADINGIADPTKIKVGQVLRLPPKAGSATAVNPAEITIEGTKAFYRFSNTTQKIFLGNLFRKGLSRIGSYNTETFISNNPALLANLKLSNSEINTLLATSKNEGNLDAVNTWDNSFMSWGMFQWTLGADGNRGELAALLKAIKTAQPAAFKTFFSDLKLDVAAETDSSTGYLILSGKKLDTPEKKEALRTNQWALNFALAGQEPKICAVEVLHAINRFNSFYFTPAASLGGKTINELLGSEYAATLLLDQHVNRPGHVFGLVAKAVAEAGYSPQTLFAGKDADELKVINKYVALRETYGGASAMTDSGKRAAVAQDFLNRGRISAKRGSFVSNRGKR